MSEILGPLGFKSLAWLPEINAYSSPTIRHPWPQGVCSMAPCSRCGSAVPKKRCSCGLYVATDDDLIRRVYASAPSRAIFLMEGRGRIVLHTKGFRAQQLKIIAVVDTSQFSRENGKIKTWELTYTHAANFYGVDIIDLETALQMIAMQCKEYNIHC